MNSIGMYSCNAVNYRGLLHIAHPNIGAGELLWGYVAKRVHDYRGEGVVKKGLIKDSILDLRPLIGKPN